MGLRKYLLKRVIISIFVLWLVATLNFAIFAIQTGDPFKFLAFTGRHLTADQLASYLEAYGVNETLPEQYVKYLKNMFSFGIVYPYFGFSLTTHRFVARDMSWRLVITVLLLGSVTIGQILAGIPIGIFAAAKRGGKFDVLAVGSGLVTWGVPTFFIQMVAILLFGMMVRDRLGILIFPTTWTSPPGNVRNLQWWGVAYGRLALPILTLIIAGFGSWVLYTRNMLVDALTSDYVVTARAKGLSERVVLYKHAFKSILPPIATMITLSIPGIVTGAIITETLFGIEGIGKWYITSMQANVGDYGVAQAVMFIFATLVIICNFIADLLYGVLDPRIRTGGG